MEKTPFIQESAFRIAVAVVLAASQPALGTGTAGADGATHPDSNDRPRLVQGYQSPLGLKPSQSGIDLLGRGSATAQLRLAQAHAVQEPLLFYAVDRVPRALGLRGAEKTAGIVVQGGGRWASSLELSSAEHALTADRSTALLGQIHAPLAAGVGVSAGIRYSSFRTPAYGGGADTPFGNGYAVPPGRADSATQQLGYQLQLNYLYGERNTVALTYSSRQDLEQYRLASDPFAFDGSQFSVTGEHWFSPSWALRYGIPTPESSGLIRRQGLRLGVQYRF